MMSGITQQHTNQQKSTILGNMDNLWFHEAIIFSQPIGVSSSTMISSQTDKTLINPNTSTITTSSSSLSLSSDDDQEMMIQQLDVEQDEALTSGVSLISISQEGDFDVVTEEEEEDGEIGEIPVTPTSDSNSSNSTTSSSTHRHQRRRRRTRIPQLDRTLSSKTFEELEEEEVKGFMDLGFNFEKNRLTPRMMSILPGLQRLQQDDDDQDKDDDNDEDDTTSTDDQSSETTPGTRKLKSRRPYLSESWSIERPDSPLLRMRMPTAFSAPDDMKRLLKVWVKTVAVAVRD